jgi:hypothetical protein
MRSGERRGNIRNQTQNVEKIYNKCGDGNRA